jgi:2-keto-4-pentenoate hydratase/2-oxohepta-3-ene-1,7-dioic acid hydratase in catechol pathway
MIRLVRFTLQDGSKVPAASWGAVTEAGIHDLGRGEQAVAPTILDAIVDWQSLKPQVESAILASTPVSQPVRLLSPVPEGGKLLCIGLNYRDHAIESGMDIPTEPVVFNKLAGTLCGPEDVVPLPGCSSQVDFEAELVLVIGKRGWQVAEADANDIIFGYTCGHDVSARDWQIGRPGGQWLLGKSFPNFAPIGPVLVPREFISDPCNLSISLRINGETLQDSSTRQLIFTPPQLISYLSQCCVLEPGDIIFTGTPPGVGMARKPPRFLASGDVCEVEVESIGILKNRFV